MTFQSPLLLAVKSIDSLVQHIVNRNVGLLLIHCISQPHDDNQNLRIFKMKHLAAYLLLMLGGNEAPSASDVKNVLGSVGIDADDDRLDKLIKELKGKDLQEVNQPRFYAMSNKILTIYS